MRLVAFLLFLVMGGQWSVFGEEVIEFGCAELPGVKIKGILHDNGLLSVDSDTGIILEPGCKCDKVTILTKAFGRVAFNENLTTCPVNNPDGHGVLLLRGTPLNEILGFELDGVIHFKRISPQSYEAVLALLFYGKDKDTRWKDVAEQVFAGMRKAAKFLTSDRNTICVGKNTMNFFVNVLREIAECHEGTELEELNVVGPQFVGMGAAITAYMNCQLTGGKFVAATENEGFTETFMRMAGVNVEDTPQRTMLNAYFDMLIGHGMNLSTSVMLQVASGGGEVINILDATLRTLDTPAHGRAAFEVVNMMTKIKTEYGGDISRYLEDVKAKRELLYGFGHRIYRKGTDPRADVMEVLVRKLRETTTNADLQNDIDLALALKESALTDEYINGMGWQPNVDYFAHLLLRGCGIDPRLATIMFATSRMGSWIADLYQYGLQDKHPIKRPQDKPAGDNHLMKRAEQVAVAD